MYLKGLHANQAGPLATAGRESLKLVALGSSDPKMLCKVLWVETQSPFRGK